MLLILFCLSGFSAQEKDKKKEKNLSDFPYRNLYARFFNPLDLLTYSYGDESSYPDLNFKIGYSSYRRDRLYFSHELFFQKQSNYSPFEQVYTSRQAIGYEFGWNYRYNSIKHDWMKAELGFGIVAASVYDYMFSDDWSFFNTINLYGIGPTFRSKLLFEVGEWGNISLGTNLKFLFGYAEYFDVDGFYYTYFQPYAIVDFLEIGVNFYLGQSKRQSKKEIIVNP